MKIIISPAKKMTDDAALSWEDMPQFLDRGEEVLSRLQQLSFEECKKLWGCSQKLAEENYERLRHMDLRRNLVPALLSYTGIQYQYMAASVLEQRSYDYLQEHLRILSGFYGVLRPFDGITPYRLEMKAKLSGDGYADLYDFWGHALYDSVMEDSWDSNHSSNRSVLNLASTEYSKCISKYLKEGDRFLTIVFGELAGGRVVQKGTLAKMARGEMVHYMASNQVSDIDELKAFDGLGYRFAPQLSSDSKYVFLK